MGFTLIEVLGIIVLLAIIAVISFVVIDRVIKSGKDRMYNKQIETIELATKNYFSDNLNSLPQGPNSLEINLGVLKVAGYVEEDIANPITGLCFSNDDTIITVKQMYDLETKKYNDNYTYEVTSASFLECSNNKIIEPDDSDEVVSPYIAAVGMLDTVGDNSIEKAFAIIYNLPNLDTSKVSIENLDSIASDCKLLISDEEELENGYQRYVGYECTNFVETQADLTLVVEAGALKNSVGEESSKVTATIHYNNVSISKDNIKFSQTLGYGPGTPTEDYYTDQGSSLPFLTIDDWLRKGEFPAVGLGSVGCHYLVVSDGEISPVTSYQGIKFIVENIDYIYYEVTSEQAERLYFETQSGHIENPSSNPVEIKVTANGLYDLKICNATNVCTTIGLIMETSDCNRPEITIDADSSSTLNSIINDYETSYEWDYKGWSYAQNKYVPIAQNIASGIRLLSVFISPYGPNDNFIKHQEHGRVSDQLISYFTLYGKAYGLLEIEVDANDTLSEVMEKAKELNYACSDLYLYIQAIDSAYNSNISYYGVVDSICNIYDGVDFSLSSCSSGNSVADMYCKMKQNSTEWYSTMSNEEKNALHRENIGLANGIQFTLSDQGLYDLNSNQIYYSNSEGAYWSCDGTSHCVSLYDPKVATSMEMYSSDDLKPVTSLDW